MTRRPVALQVWLRAFECRRRKLPHPTGGKPSRLPAEVLWLAQVRAEQRLAVEMVRDVPIEPWPANQAVCDNEGEVN